MLGACSSSAYAMQSTFVEGSVAYAHAPALLMSHSEYVSKSKDILIIVIFKDDTHPVLAGGDLTGVSRLYLIYISF